MKCDCKSRRRKVFHLFQETFDSTDVAILNVSLAVRLPEGGLNDNHTYVCNTVYPTSNGRIMTSNFDKKAR